MNRMIVVGGGAAGMLAAITAAEYGQKVVLLEGNKRVGKKLLSTGNGRCNMTNLFFPPDCYRGENPDFAHLVIKKFDVQDTIRFFTGKGIYTVNRNGYIYPNSNQAASVLDVLRMELEHLGVVVVTEAKVVAAERTKEGFLVRTGQETYRGRSLVLAAGGRAAPAAGSDGSGYELARFFGHRIIKPLPALTQLKAGEQYLKGLAGVRQEGGISLMIDGKLAAADRGELLFTAYGLSGIPVFQVSRYAAKALDQGQKVTALVNFMPDMKEAELFHFLQSRVSDCPYKPAGEMLTGLFQKKINLCLLKLSNIPPTKPAGDLTKEELLVLAGKAASLAVRILAVNDFSHAQVCAGGVDTAQLKPTMESRLVSGLYFAGEIVDIDGMCGGYNLQWAWSSGYVAGRAATKVRGRAGIKNGKA